MQGNPHLRGQIPEKWMAIAARGHTIRFESLTLPPRYRGLYLSGQRVIDSLILNSLSDLRHDQSLTSLDLSNRNAYGDVAIFEDLPHLTSLNLRNNNLRVLYSQRTRISFEVAYIFQGVISSDLMDILVECDRIDLSHNPLIDQSNIEGFVVCNHSRLKDIVHLEGPDCGLTGPIQSLTKLTKLQSIDLSFNSLTGQDLLFTSSSTIMSIA